MTPRPLPLFLASALLLVLALAACKSRNTTSEPPTSDTIPLTDVRFDADSAYASIVRQCSFGARVPGSEAHRRCGDYIAASFRSLGLRVTEQRVDQRAWDGTTLHTRNIIASYHPERTDRIVLASHWESRPWADADADTANHRQPVMAANDGASGVAVMLEVARQLTRLNPAVGIDFVCFDSEDYGAPYWASDKAPADGSDWCLGSQYWSAHPHAKGYTARYGILLDMVGGLDARFCYEGISMRYARDVMVKVWDAAQRVGAGQLFRQEEGGWAQDDHVPMNEVAGIPTIDIIPSVGGDRPFGATWHTIHDTPENISKENLRLVGQTLLQVLSEEK